MKKVIFIILLLILACNGSATATKEASQDKQPQIQVHEVGQTIEAGNYNLTVIGLEKIEGDEFTKPDEGNEFVAVEVLLANQGEQPASLSTMLQMHLKDKEDRKYDVDLMATSAIKGGSIDGELSPGEKVRGQVGFQIPVNNRDLQFVFDASIFGSGKVFVRLPNRNDD